ncbi:GIY-YIG catalytic domain-containing endonuclease [Acanthocystis turfacea Chlorella virus GM0701.1]|nr:GIY-YIG catalytic domain-containing endonuclease [Acanthocystis turfacea Chlorella virus GM0701.1]
MLLTIALGMRFFEHYDGRKICGGKHRLCIYKLSYEGKSYIGQTNCTRKRFRKHRTDPGCRYLYNAIQKHGWDKFSKEILFKNLTLDEANIIEDEMIEQYNSLAPNGFNLRSGGDHYEMSSDAIQRMSEATKKQWESEEFRKLRCQAANKQWADEEFRRQASEVRRAITEEEFKEKFYDLDRDKDNVMTHFGISEKSFYRYLHRCGISLTDIKKKKIEYPRKFTDEEFLEANKVFNGKIPYLATFFDVTITTIKEHRKRLGLSRPYNKKVSQS